MDHVSAIITRFIRQNMEDRGLALYFTDDDKLLAMDEEFEQEIQIADTRESTEKKVLLSEAHAAAMEELQRIPEDYRQAVILRDIEEMSYDDISRTLSISMSNVKVRIHRGREMLKKRMAERGLL